MNRQYKNIPIQSSEITPESLYLSRREWLKKAGLVGAGALLAACGIAPTTSPTASPTPENDQTFTSTSTNKASDELGAQLTDFDAITGFVNYYEFSTDKQAVAKLAEKFTITLWQIEVGGMVHKPKTYGIEDLLRKFPRQERIYRMRCVEGWSMVIPWLGFPLASLLKEVEPMSSARYVRFETILRPEEMPGQNSPFFDWPYVEGLRLDEAMHDLTIVCTGLYGKDLPAQNGAPVRLVVPWKYGFKSPKSLVKIDLVEQQPATFWSVSAPHEYGFYSNVNPEKSHPRWSQATERRIGETGRRPTLMFNGYADQVAYLYKDMDLNIYY
ncbi:MAG: protein-methionine-sulfoxide reductase catalytic subunit MsrP [Anaerolineae bacterium]|nr:protein-methionine-sulfoxide reductase catalytic subunit MsrP [Anaerolineae bacterium]